MRDIPEFTNYCATKDGRIWSKPRKGTKGGFLKPKTTLDNHLCVNLYKNGKSFTQKIHRLVLNVYDKPCPERMECRHLDGNPHNNDLSNLKWGTRSENAMDAVKHGTIIGENHSQNKLNESSVRMIIYIYHTGLFSMQKVGNMYGVCTQTIHNIIHKKTWKHIWA